MVDLAIVVDASGSIKKAGAENWDLVIEFVLSIIDGFDVGASKTRIGLVTFSNKAFVQIKLNDYYNKEDLKQEIRAKKEDYYEDGMTNTSVSIYLCSIYKK